VKGALGLAVGFLVALGARTALAETPAGTPPAPPRASTNPSAEPAGAPTDGSAAPVVSTPAPAPPTAPTLTIGMPQPTVRHINQSIGIGVALTYVSIPLVFISGGVLGVGYLVDSDGVKVTGWIMAGTSLALFGVGVGFLVSGSEQGPQPQKSASSGRATRFDLPAHPQQRDTGRAGDAIAVPVLSGSF
jgi:hypothetical protein